MATNKKKLYDVTELFPHFYIYINYIISKHAIHAILLGPRHHIGHIDS